MLPRLLASIAAQTLAPDEVIVVDDGSVADYGPVIHAWRQKIPNLRYVKSEKNLGAPRARNRGILEAASDWIALVDDDDEWMATKLERQQAIIQEGDPALGLIYTFAEAKEVGKTVWRYSDVFEGRPLRELLSRCFIPSPSVLARKSALIASGLFDETLSSCQDWDMWTRLLAKGYTLRVVPSVEVIYHKHNGPTIGASPKAREGLLRYYQKHRLLYRKYRPLHYARMLLSDGKQWLKKYL